MNYRMRMLSGHRRQLEALLSDASREQACFLLCRSAQGDDETLLLVHDVLPLQDGELLIHAADQLSVSPTAMLRMARRAQSLESSLCMVHTHPMCSGQVAFSWADDVGNLRTFDFLNRMLPGQPNSCLVWDRELQCVAGRVYETANSWKAITAVDLINESRWVRYQDRTGPEQIDVAARFDRQARLLGKQGQAILKAPRIGIVGNGGIGSIAATLLGHSGLRDLTLVDFDVVDSTNLPRLLGATEADVQNKVPKTEVIRRSLAALDTSIRLQCIQDAIEQPSNLPKLVSLEVIVCATDDTTSRAYLNQICQQYYVPVLDLGVQFVADPDTGQLVREIGKVNLTLPGTPCLACVGHIDPKVLADEGLPPEQRAKRKAEGYIRGIDTPEPSMMVFNMQVASKGIQLLIAWLTGLHSIDPYSYERISFMGLVGPSGSARTRKRSEDTCPICSLPHGIVGTGDGQAMLVRPRTRAK